MLAANLLFDIVGESEKIFFLVRVNTHNAGPDQLHENSRSAAIAHIDQPAEFPDSNSFIRFQVLEQFSFIFADSDSQRGGIRVFVPQNLNNLTACHYGLIVHADIHPGILTVFTISLSEKIMWFVLAFVNVANDNVSPIKGYNINQRLNRRIAKISPRKLNKFDLRLFAFHTNDRSIVIDT